MKTRNRRDQYLWAMPNWKCRAFSLLELLVIVAVVLMLAGAWLATAARRTLRVQEIQCMNNHRQLCMAWRLYSDDNQERLLYASDNPYDPTTIAGTWVTGYLQWR